METAKITGNLTQNMSNRSALSDYEGWGMFWDLITFCFYRRNLFSRLLLSVPGVKSFCFWASWKKKLHLLVTSFMQMVRLMISAGSGNTFPTGRRRVGGQRLHRCHFIHRHSRGVATQAHARFSAHCHGTDIWDGKIPHGNPVFFI